jgi:hypothetical protein
MKPFRFADLEVDVAESQVDQVAVLGKVAVR